MLKLNSMSRVYAGPLEKGCNAFNDQEDFVVLRASRRCESVILKFTRFLHSEKISNGIDPLCLIQRYVNTSLLAFKRLIKAFVNFGICSSVKRIFKKRI